VGLPSNDWRALANIEYTHLVFRAVENQMAMIKAGTVVPSHERQPAYAVARTAILEKLQR